METLSPVLLVSMSCSFVYTANPCFRSKALRAQITLKLTDTCVWKARALVSNPNTGKFNHLTTPFSKYKYIGARFDKMQAPFFFDLSAIVSREIWSCGGHQRTNSINIRNRNHSTLRYRCGNCALSRFATRSCFFFHFPCRNGKVWSSVSPQ